MGSTGLTGAASCAVLAIGESWAGPGGSPPGALIHHAVSEALRGQPFGVKDVDFVVDAGSDIVDGRSISNVSFIEFLGAQRKDEWRVEEDGIFAAQFVQVMLEAGAGDLALLVAYGSNAELSMDQYWNLSTVPFLERSLGLTRASAGALQRQRYASHFGLDPGAGVPAPRAGSAAVALLVASVRLAGRLTSRPLAWLRGMGQATEAAVFAERDLWRSPSAERAWRETLASCDLELGEADLARVELSAAYPHELPILVEAMGFAGPGQGAGLLGDRKGLISEVPSTSVVPADGLLRLATAVRTLAAAPADGPPYAVAHGSGGLALQKNGFVLVERAA